MNQKIITIRYRDKFVDLVSDTDRYGTMTRNTEGNRIEFDFSECRVIGVRDVTPNAEWSVGRVEGFVPTVVDENAPQNGVLITRGQLEKAARQIGYGDE